MTKEKFKEELVWKFNLVLSENGEKLLDKMIDELRTKEKVIYKSFKYEDKINDPQLLELAKRAAAEYKADYRQMFSNCRKKEVVSARAHFCRQAKIEFGKVSCTSLGDFLNMNHTSILHLWYSKKIICKIEPFYHPTFTKLVKSKKKVYQY